MRRLAAAGAFLLAGFAASAQATGTIECAAADESDAAVTIITGAGPVRVPVRVAIGAGGASWTTGGGEGRAVIVLQSFDDGERFSVDLADPQVTEVLVRLRLARAESGTDQAEAGTLDIAGAGVHPIVCAGP
jgi:hypothetical protein